MNEQSKENIMMDAAAEEKGHASHLRAFSAVSISPGDGQSMQNEQYANQRRFYR